MSIFCVRSRRVLVAEGAGAGAVVLEVDEHALAWDARADAELAGYGTTCDPVSMGRAAPSPREMVNCMKSLVGHCLGASAMVEVVATVLAISEGVIPPSANCTRLDPACSFLDVATSARKERVQVALKNSFSLGNRNTTLIFREYELR